MRLDKSQPIQSEKVMRKIVAIQPDDYSSDPSKEDASSPRWAKALEKKGVEVRWVDVYRADILDQLQGCHGFMWRWAHFNGMARIARRLLPVIERELKLAVYPDQNTCWHYDDKIAQAYLLKAAGIPHPLTWVWFDRDKALAWLEQAFFPMVMKLATGAGASNVVLLKNKSEAATLTRKMFAGFQESLTGSAVKQARRAIKGFAKGTPLLDRGYEPQAGYAFFQEFLPENDFDTRVTVIGNRAFAFRRMNRPNDFRASGSGQIDWNIEQIDQGFVQLAFEAAAKLKAQSMAIDGLYRGKEPVIGEISYTYGSWAVAKCPGHWRQTAGRLEWIPRPMWPEEAQIEDFLLRLKV
jgi:hypothetical protein